MLRKVSNIVNPSLAKLSHNRARFLSVRTGVTVRSSAIDHDGCFGLRNMEPTQVALMHAPVIERFHQQKKCKSTSLTM